MKTMMLASLFLILAMPCLAHTKNKKPIVPNSAFVNAKVLGVHCDPGVGLDTCQAIIDGFRVSALDYTVRNCPTVMDPETEEARVKCLPKDDADLMLFVSADYSYDDADGVVETTLMTQMYCELKLCPKPVNGGRITSADFKDEYNWLVHQIAFEKLVETYVKTLLKYGAPKRLQRKP